MVLKCRYCGEVMDKVYEQIPTSAEIPYACTYKCFGCETTNEFDESHGRVELWIDKEGEIEVVELV